MEENELLAIDYKLYAENKEKYWNYVKSVMQKRAKIITKYNDKTKQIVFIENYFEPSTKLKHARRFLYDNKFDYVFRPAETITEDDVIIKDADNFRTDSVSQLSKKQLEELNEAQKLAIKKFSNLSVGALFMKMGTGKTLTAIRLMETKKPNNILVLAPKSTLYNFKEEVNKWSENPQLYTYVGYESLGCKTGEQAEQKFDGIILDETIYLKNPDAKRTRYARAYARNCKYKLILNGTPTASSIIDLKSQIDILDPEIINMGNDEFKEKFCDVKLMKFRNTVIEKVKTSEKNVDILVDKLRSYVMNASLELDIELKEEIIKCDLSEEEEEEITEEIKTLTAKMSRDYETEASKEKLQEMIILTLHRYTAYSKERAKAVVKNISSKNPVIFVNFITEMGNINKLHECYCISGSLDNEDREGILNAWRKNQDKPLLLTYGVGAFGLNLQETSHEIILSSRTFSKIQHDQAIARVYRQGQEKDVVVKIVKCNNDVENIVNVIHQKKLKLSDAVKKGIVKVNK